MPRTTFRPQVDGFAFRNSFTLTDDERAGLSAAATGAIDGALSLLGPFGVTARILRVDQQLGAMAVSAMPEHYGLCGGMAFAALDYYFAGQTLPRGSGTDDQPPVGSALCSYLWQRVLDSWAANGVTFLEWIARLHLLPTRWPFGGGASALRDRSRSSWKQLRSSIDMGVPVPIGLVGDAQDPFLDHQIVAIGYEVTSERGGRILVYDENCPGAEGTIEFDLGASVLSATETCTRPDNPLRGFFCERYARRVPPIVR